MSTTQENLSDYRTRLFLAQKAMGKTRGDLIRVMGATAFLVISCLAFAVIMGGIIYNLPEILQDIGGSLGDLGVSFKDLFATMGIFLGPLLLIVVAVIAAAPFLIVKSLFELVRDGYVLLTKPAKDSNCPACSANAKLLANVESYVCPACSLPMLFTGSELMVLTECPVCKQKMSVSKDSNSIDCPNCESKLSPNPAGWAVGGSIIEDIERCPGCEAARTQTQTFCPQCGTILRKNHHTEITERLFTQFFAPTFEGLDVRDKKSRAAAEKLLGKNVEGTLADAASRISHSEEYIDAADIQKLLEYATKGDLEFAMLQSADGIDSEDLRPRTIANLQKADVVHADFLDALRKNIEDKETFFANTETVDIIAKTYFKNRYQLLQRLEAIDKESASGFKKIKMVYGLDGRGVSLMFSEFWPGPVYGDNDIVFDLFYKTKGYGGGWEIADLDQLTKAAAALRGG